MPHQEEDCEDYHRRAPGNQRKNASSPPHPAAAGIHRSAQQQRERRVARHRVILLRGGKCEENQNEGRPAKCQQARFSRAIQWLERKLRDGRKVNAPRKKPREVKKPEIEARNGVVISRVAEVQKSKKLFVDEKEPEKPMILPRPAMQRERKIRRVAHRRENVPGSRDQNHDQCSRKRMKAL